MGFTKKRKAVQTPWRVDRLERAGCLPVASRDQLADGVLVAASAAARVAVFFAAAFLAGALAAGLAAAFAGAAFFATAFLAGALAAGLAAGLAAALAGAALPPLARASTRALRASRTRASNTLPPSSCALEKAPRPASQICWAESLTVLDSWALLFFLSALSFCSFLTMGPPLCGWLGLPGRVAFDAWPHCTPHGATGVGARS